MLAEEMRRAAVDSIMKLKAVYKQRAFELLVTDQVDEAKQMAAISEAMSSVIIHVDQALRRAGEDE